MISTTSKLNDLFRPGKPLPPDDVMVKTALNILNYSAHGQQLTEFVKNDGISIKILATPQPVTYLPEPKQVYVGFNRNIPLSPSRFVLMLAGILREAVQEANGIKHPPLSAPVDEHMKISMAKHEDKVWFMCTVAIELNNQELFTEYKFLDELKKMGHDESLALYMKQQSEK